MYRVQFLNDTGLKQVAYVIANWRIQAEAKVIAAYPTAVITSAEPWPFDMVVM